VTSAALRGFATWSHHLRWILSPPVCEVCQDPQPRFEMLCGACETELRPIEAACAQCALPLPGQGLSAHRCADCLAAPPAFDRVWAPFLWNGTVARAVHAAKFGKQSGPLRYLARSSRELFDQACASFRPDFLLPVPLSFFRQLGRGYNQSCVLAREWVKSSGRRIAWLEGMRRSHRRPQALQDRASRMRALHGSFRFSGGSMLRGRRILIVDDILTTGSTAEIIARTLRAAGAAAVEVAVLARVPRNHWTIKPKEETT